MHLSAYELYSSDNAKVREVWKGHMGMGHMCKSLEKSYIHIRKGQKGEQNI
jgi:hypothetical protein